MKFYGISCYCFLYTHTHLSVYLNLGKECMKQPYFWIDIILRLKIIFPECYLGCENNPVSPPAFLLDSYTTSVLTQPPCSHHLPAHTISLLTPPLAHFTLTPPPCSHHFPAHTTPCSLYSHTISLLTLLSHHPWLTLLSHHLLAHFTLTPSPCSLYSHTIPCSLYSHTTSLLTPLLSDTRQTLGWEVPTPSSPLWPQLGVLWLNSVLKTQSYI